MGGMDFSKPALAMIGLQFTYAGVALFTRAAFLQGLSPRIFVVYRQGIATLMVAPVAYVSRRKNSCRTNLGLKGFGWIFLASLIGVTANQNAYFEGIYRSSSTIASAMINLVPAVTFLLATFFGLEKVNIRSLRSIAKILGTIICVSGAICMALLKGPKLLNAEFHLPKSLFRSEGENWLLGCLLLLGSSFFWSFWIILQVPISANCPDHLYTSTWMCFLATLESAAVAFFAGENPEAWSLNSMLELGCCLYTGIVSAVSFFVQAWCISQRGPLFAAMFNPLCTVIVTIFAALFLQEETYIGGLLGAFAVIIGLYIVLWGKAQDLEEVKQGMDSKQVLKDESLDKRICKVDLEEPLLA
ncbi:hypothetical protein SLE2022_271440 [Rubroshorea leprosula]